ncbi:Short-chain dehydrogenase [Marinobacter daqiaonensis]|uniref:Short-chain dehydrogenase n=1 Tax=Marinobacter daqiaonensis TaxID=650891 RepID=A0A1I6I537_9GAMM|nr:SDR family oxidoreductase [Marinobacter daqiaonensis]SFR61779.1 Short-chain dehydrogenase [Marinobacter daqiaonensis]
MRKNILITGASSGLGEGMARAFAAKGCSLALCARSTEKLARLQSELLANYPNIRVFVRSLDVCEYDDVFEVFRGFRDDLGSLDRVIVNAGMGSRSAIGSGDFPSNRKTVETNFVAALAQCEAAMEILKDQNEGHLVLMSSVSAVRGFRGSINVYAATKAAVASLAEGLQLDTLGSPIRVSCILPGYILTDINRDVENAPFRVDLETGVQALVKAIEKEKRRAYVPSWPWTPLSHVLRALPFRLYARAM